MLPGVKRCIKQKIMERTRLYRIVNGRVIGGVAGGIAEYFNIDPTIVRILFVLLTIFGGGGVLIYLVMWIAVPEKYSIYPPFTNFNRTESSGTTDYKTSGSGSFDNTSGSTGSTGRGETYTGYTPGSVPPKMKTDTPPVPNSGLDGSLIAGIILIIMGGFFLVERFVPAINFSDFWPLLIIVIGLFLIFKGFPMIKKESNPVTPGTPDESNDNNSNNINI
jgi:phage shock protein PspC (stress-responsive transcriptional regulator)